jgi:Ca-activated chloride channel homolog
MRRGMLHTFAILILAVALSMATQVSTIKVSTEEVRIDMLVTDQGKPVTGLREADFEVFDNGVLQKIEFSSFQQMPINATLVFDMSASVAGESLKHLISAGSGFLDRLKKDEQAALITFGHAVKLGSPLTGDIESVKTALKQAKPFGNTSLIDACYAGLTLAESKSSRPLLVVFSDGLDTSSWLSDEMVLEIAKRSDAVVYAVSIGQLPDQTFIRDLSKFTGGSLIQIESTRNLDAIFLRILEEFRQRYLLTYLPRGVSKDGWHQLKIQVKGRIATIKARPGYQAGTRISEGE